MSSALKKPAKPAGTAYQDDLYTWVVEQVALLRAGRLSEIDAENIAEELGDVGLSEHRELRSILAVLMQHLLKWDFQRERRSRSWVLTIDEQRDRLRDSLRRSPGLRPQLPEITQQAWRSARRRTLDETGLADEALPADNPYDWEAVVNRPVVYDPAIHRLKD